MSQVKYLLRPGNIMADGQVRWVGSAELIGLYNVPAHECITEQPWTHQVVRDRGEELIVLAPDPTGRYEVPRA